MSPSVSVESSTQSLTNQPLNPILQGALSSLDVQLEVELARYRRRKAGRPAMPAHSWQNQKVRKHIELISLDTGKSENFVTEAGAENSAYSPLPINQTASISEVSSLSSPVSHANAELSIDSLVSGSDSHSSQPSSQGNLISTTPPQAPPDDYLASSEELLRSLAEEASLRKKRAFPKVFSPVGVGLMLLLLLSSTTVGYMIMNPTLLTALGERFKKSPTSPVAQNPTTTVTIPDSAPQPNTLGFSGPNLAAGEFVELNLNNLSSLKIKHSSNPTPVNRPATLSNSRLGATPLPNPTGISVSPPVSSQGPTGQSPDLASAILPPSLQPVRIPPRNMPGTVPQSQFAPANPPNIAMGMQQLPATSGTSGKAVATNQQQNSYYVLTNYDSDRTLGAVRKVVSSASVQKFPEGKRIQVAGFSKKSDAQSLVQQLQKQGIAAWVYQP